MAWDFGFAREVYDRMARGFIAYYRQVGLDRVAADMQEVYEDGETGLVATEGFWICDNENLPMPSDLVDEFMKLSNKDPDYYKEELEVLETFKRTDPILPTLQVA